MIALVVAAILAAQTTPAPSANAAAADNGTPNRPAANGAAASDGAPNGDAANKGAATSGAKSASNGATNGAPAVPRGPASAPSSQPALLERGGTGADVTADVTLIYELDEGRFQVQESWTLNNNSRKLVDSLSWTMPKGTFRLTVDETARSFAANEVGTAFGTTGALGPGQHGVGARYFLSFQGASAAIQRRIPVNMTTARVIVEDIAGMSISGNTKVECRPRELNGLDFRVCTFGGVGAGEMFEVRFGGLPNRSGWPRILALALSLAFLGWMAYALSRPLALTAAQRISPISAEARRDQIVRAMELLKEDFDAERIGEKRFERRRKELLAQLAAVLREIELSKA